MFEALFASAIAFSLFEWIALAVAFVFIVLSISVYAEDAFGLSFFTMLLCFVAIGYVYHQPLIAYFHSTSLIHAIMEPIALYLAIGVGVSFVNWILFCMHVKTRYRNMILPYLTDSDAFQKYANAVIKNLNDGRPTPIDPLTVTDDFIRRVLQLDIAANNKDHIFGRSYKVNTMFDLYSLKHEQSILSVEDTIAKKMAELFPPKTLRGKAILASAVFEWPITILSILFSRFLTVIVDKVIFVSRKFIDLVSHVAFGSHEIKL